jgi:Invasion associated locus B (IalB) protein.
MMKYAGMIALVLAASSAQAETVHGSWKSFEDGGRCHAVSYPASSSGEIAGRTLPYVAIQNIPAEHVRGSVSIVSGSESTGEGDVRVTVDGKEFEALPFGSSAFAASGRPEAALVTAMRRGSEMIVEWSAKDGTKVTDTYDLAGFTAAKKAIDSACR